MQQIRKERQSGFEWYNSKATPEQRKLSDRIHDLSVYFEDMRFEQGTPTYELMKCKAYDEEADVWEDYYLDPPDEVAFFNYAWFAYTVEPQDDCDGYFNPATQELCITPDYLDDDPTVLHEMIHLHEYVYDCAPSFVHDMAFGAFTPPSGRRSRSWTKSFQPMPVCSCKTHSTSAAGSMIFFSS